MHDREKRVKKILEKSNSFLTGHFRYTSGRHGNQYINKDAIYPNTKHISELCQYMAEPFVKKQIDTVLGPAMGGVILAQRVAEHLTMLTRKTIYGVYADKSKDGNSLEIKRGYDAFVKDKNVLIVEDILNTGGSAKKAIELVQETGGTVVGLSALVNRGNVQPINVNNTPIHSLLMLTMETFEEAHCPLCKKNIPLDTNVGHAKK